MKFWPASFLLLMTLPLAAQQPAVDKPPEKGSANGIVLKAGSDEPVRHAAIRLSSSENNARNYRATTDAEGRFEIKAIEPGRYSLQVERERFRVQRLGVGSVWSRGREHLPVVLSPGQKLDIVAYLVPGGVVAGRVLDADGEPLSNTEVLAMRNAFSSGKKRLVMVEQTQTNDLGEYRLHGLRAGSYYVQASPGGGWMPAPPLATAGSSSKEPLVYAPTFYPGVHERADATMLEVKPGEEVRADFFLVPTPAVRVRGRLVGATSAQSRTRVMLVPRDGFGFVRRNAEVQKDGNFQLDAVLPGSYTLIAFAASSQGLGQLASQKIDVGKADVDNLTLTMAPTEKTTVRGRVRIEGTSSIDPAGLMVSLRPDDADDFRRYVHFGGRGKGFRGVDPDGTFEFEDVMDGTYRLEVSGRRGLGWSPAELSGLYVKSVTVRNRDSRDEGFTISEGRVGGPIEVVLSAAAAQIEGIVLDETQLPVAGIRVLAAPEEKRRHLDAWYENDVTDQNGRFLMRGVRPGSYTVLALDGGDDTLYGSNDPEMIKRYEDKGMKVTVKENERRAVELKVIKVEEEWNR